MPAATPIYGIPYPCATDAVDPDIFCGFAEAVDTAMQGVQALSTASLNRPSAQVTTATPLPLPSGLDTVTVYTTVPWDNDGMVNLGVSSSRITAQTHGTYLLAGNAIVTPFGGGNLLSASISFWRNGVLTYRKRDVEADFIELTLGGLVDLDVGDYVQMFLSYTGTVSGLGQAMYFGARMTNTL